MQILTAMRAKWLRVTAVATLVLLPFLVAFLYGRLTAIPDAVIATGPTGGRYREVSRKLADDTEAKLGIAVTLQHTRGSMENLRLLAEGDVDFALYQPGTHEVLAEDDFPSLENIAFVANAYSETLHIFVRKNSGIADAEHLRGKTIAVGQKTSGDYAASRVLLRHLGLDEHTDIKSKKLDYDGIRAGMADESLDAAFVTTGSNAKIIRDLLAGGDCRLIPVPHPDAFVRHNISFHVESIPAGLYRGKDGPQPVEAISTVALNAQLLTRRDTPDRLVSEVTRIFLDEKFLRRNALQELFQHGHDFARRKPEFPVHDGAAAVYDPELRPVLNSNFVEAMEGMRSFIVSILIAGFLAYRWWTKRQLKQQEHRLDRYIHELLNIERQQLELDESPDGTTRDVNTEFVTLQKLLDESTHLRQEALSEFTAHELNEDRATDAFLEMCHALSDKINARLTRLRLDKGFGELRQSLSEMPKN